MKINKAMLRVFVQIISLTSNYKSALKGLLLDFDEQKIVASDGKILLAIKAELSGSGKIIVSLETLKTAYKSAEKNTSIKFTEKAIFIDSKEFAFTPLDKNYPDWKTVIPEEVPENEQGQFGFYKSVYIDIIEQIEKAVSEFYLYHESFTYQLPKRHFRGLKGTLLDEVTMVLMPLEVAVRNKHFGEEDDKN